MNIQENSKIKINLDEINQNKLNKLSQKNKRIEFFDWLRILCCFLVIVIHNIPGKKLYSSLIHSYEWKIINFYYSLIIFAVPIFFMISGTLFLEKDISFGIMLKKYIKIIYVKLLFWSFLYSLRGKIIYKYNYKKAFLIFLKGHYHLWLFISYLWILFNYTFFKTNH